MIGIDLEPSDYSHHDVSTRLVTVTPDIEDLVLASILLNADSSTRMAELKRIVSKMSIEQRKAIARAEMETRDEHDLLPKSLEAGSFVFERVYDIGAYRDLHRQRGDRQQCSPFQVIGYNLPKEFRAIGMEKEFIQRLEEVKELNVELREAGHEFAAEHCTVMANLIIHLVTKDPTQCFYEAELRTQPAGIDSYRKIAQDEIKIVLEHMPSFKGLVKFDDNNYPLGRLEDSVLRIIREGK